MSTGFALGIDVGSTATKAVVCDVAGNTVGRGSAPTRIDRPQPGWAEIDYAACWQSATAACRAALSSLPENGAPGRVIGIGLSSLAPSVAPLAADGTPLHPGIIYEDKRSTAHVERLLARTRQDDAVARTGIRIESGSTTLSSMLWLMEQRPELVGACATLGSLTTYLAQRLTGNVGIDWSNAQLSGLFALDDPPRWLEDWCAELGIPTAKLPPPLPSQACVGCLSNETAKALGLPPGIPVAMGGADAQTAAVGAGLVAPGAGLLSLGTTCVFTVSSARRVTDARFYTRRHVFPGRYLHVAPTLLGGATLQWAAALLGLKSVEALMALAATSTPGAGGALFLPYLLGERAPLWDRNARGAFVGLHVGAERADIARAVLEGIAFAVRDVLALLEDRLGARIAPLSVTGGAAQPIFLRILASVLARPLNAIEGGDAAAQGAALLASVAAERMAMDRLAASRPRVQVTHAPEESDAERYGEAYAAFRTLYPALKHTFAPPLS